MSSTSYEFEWTFSSKVSKEMNNLPQLPPIFIGNWTAARFSGTDFIPRLTRDPVLADYIVRLTQVQVAGYEFQLIPSSGWLRVAADSIMRLTQNSPAKFDLPLTYTFICPINLRTYSAKYIIFIAFFLPSDFIYHWILLLKNLEEALRSMNKL